MKRQALWVAVAGAMLALSFVAPAFAQDAAPTCTARNVTTANSTTYEAGDQIAVSGGKFDANALVKVNFVQAGRETELGQVRTGSDGNFDTAALGTKVPDNAAKGSASVTATGELGGQSASCAVAIDVDGLPSTGIATQLLGLWGFTLLGGGSLMLGATRSRGRRGRAPRRPRAPKAPPARPRVRRDPVGPMLPPIEAEPAFEDAFTPEPAYEKAFADEAPMEQLTVGTWDGGGGTPVDPAVLHPVDDAIATIDELLREWSDDPR